MKHWHFFKQQFNKYVGFNSIQAKKYLFYLCNLIQNIEFFLHKNSISIQRFKVYKQKYLFYLCTLILINEILTFLDNNSISMRVLKVYK